MQSKLRELANIDVNARPFLCEGNPYECDVFLVGINPATSTGFWDYWNPEVGCDKEGWIDSYLHNHDGKFKPTRKRIELFFDGVKPLKVLETNIFPFPSCREHELSGKSRNTEFFDFLLHEIGPKVVVGHGSSVIKHFSKLFGRNLEKGKYTAVSRDGVNFEVRVENHFSYQWSYDAIRNLAENVKEHCS